MIDLLPTKEQEDAAMLALVERMEKKLVVSSKSVGGRVLVTGLGPTDEDEFALTLLNDQVSALINPYTLPISDTFFFFFSSSRMCGTRSCSVPRTSTKPENAFFLALQDTVDY